MWICNQKSDISLDRKLDNGERDWCHKFYGRGGFDFDTF